MGVLNKYKYTLENHLESIEAIKYISEVMEEQGEVIPVELLELITEVSLLINSELDILEGVEFGEAPEEMEEYEE